MIAATKIAADIGLCDNAVYERIAKATRAWGPLPKVTIQTAKALKLMQSDKKTEAGSIHFVLPREIGKVEIVKNVPAERDRRGPRGNQAGVAWRNTWVKPR